MVLPVLIAGAGPVGLTMAAELARYGVRVRIVDTAAARTDKSKALVLWSRTLELLDRAACADTFVGAGLKVEGASVFAGGKRISHVSLEGIDSAFPFALMLPQSETERLLEAHLGRLGVSVERSVGLAGFTPGPHGVEAMLRHPDGRLETLSADWLIGCDGAHSTVRHGLGFDFEGDTLKSDWVLADVHIHGNGAPDAEIVTYWHHEGVLVLFPIAPGRYRVIADTKAPQQARPVDPTLAEVQAIVDRRGPGDLTLGEPIWLAAFRINERKVTDYRSGRVFLAGDAAHIHSPAGGQGMNTGMQDAVNLAWKLALVFHGTCKGDRLLDSYSPERSAVGAQVLADAGRLTAIATLRNPVVQGLRNLIAGLALGLAPVRNAMADTLSELSIGYPESPLNGPARGHDEPRPGRRVAPVPGRRPIGAGDRPLFALMAERSEATDGLIAAYAGLLEPDVRPPPHVGGAWLVRPDGYVAATAGAAEVGLFSGVLTDL